MNESQKSKILALIDQNWDDTEKTFGQFLYDTGLADKTGNRVVYDTDERVVEILEQHTLVAA